MKKPLRIKSLLFGLAGLMALAACSMERDEMANGHAKLNVLMVDAPGDYEEVWVEVLSVAVLPEGKEGANESAWITMDYGAGENNIELLSLVGEKQAWLGSKELPAGKISQVRVILGENNYLVKGGEEIPLTTPSAQQSGLKLQVNRELLAGTQYDLILDFNVAQSIVSAGNSGKHILKPVIKVVAEAAASIKGKIMNPDADPLIYGILEQDTVSTFTDENGNFQLRGLTTGEYAVHIYPEDPFSPEFLEGISTVEGEVTDLGDIELPLDQDIPAE